MRAPVPHVVPTRFWVTRLSRSPCVPTRCSRHRSACLRRRSTGKSSQQYLHTLQRQRHDRHHDLRNRAFDAQPHRNAENQQHLQQLHTYHKQAAPPPTTPNYSHGQQLNLLQYLGSNNTVVHTVEVICKVFELRNAVYDIMSLPSPLPSPTAPAHRQPRPRLRLHLSTLSELQMSENDVLELIDKFNATVSSVWVILFTNVTDSTEGIYSVHGAVARAASPSSPAAHREATSAPPVLVCEWCGVVAPRVA